MNNLPVAASVVVDQMQRQFRPDRTDADLRVPPVHQPVRRARVVAADALAWAAEVIAPRGHPLAH